PVLPVFVCGLTRFCSSCPRYCEIPPPPAHHDNASRQNLFSCDGEVFIGDLDVVEVGTTIGNGAPGLAASPAQTGVDEEVDDRVRADVQASAGKLGDSIAQRLFVEL